MVDKEESAFVQNVLKFGAKNGYKAYAVKGHQTFGYLITPSDNVLVVNKGDFWGVSFTFSYVPSREHGSGCACSDDPVTEITVALLKELEGEGYHFARELGAKLYANSSEWLKNCYWKDSLVEIAREGDANVSV